jgi:hypothetical protein
MKRFCLSLSALLLAAVSFGPLYAQGTALPSRTIATSSGGVSAAAVFPLTNKNILVPAEGSYFIVRNPTPGTGIAGAAAATTLDDTKPLLLIKNNATALSNINIYLDYIRFRLTNAGTAGTNVRFDMKVDYSSRYTSGGSALTPTNVNSNSVAQSVASNNVFFGALTATAASSNVRLLDGHEFRPVIGVVGDTYTINFGGVDHPTTGLITSGTAITHSSVNFHPVVLGPGQTFLLHQWSASQSGAYQFEVTCGYFER